MNWQRNRSRIESEEFRFFTLFDDICGFIKTINAKDNETEKNIRTVFDYWENIY